MTGTEKLEAAACQWVDDMRRLAEVYNEPPEDVKDALILALANYVIVTLEESLSGEGTSREHADGRAALAGAAIEWEDGGFRIVPYSKVAESALEKG